MGIIKHFKDDHPAYCGPPPLCGETHVIPPCLIRKNIESRLKEVEGHRTKIGILWNEVRESYRLHMISTGENLHEKCKECRFGSDGET